MPRRPTLAPYIESGKDGSAMKKRSLTSVLPMLAVLTLCLLGCGEATIVSDEAPLDSGGLRVVSGSGLQEFVDSSPIPVLVEFGVDYNCERCRSMKPDMVQLADRYRRKAEVVRVDYGSNLPLVARYGGTICPTYVLFNQGQPIEVRSYPTSQDLLEADLVGLMR